MNTISLIFEQKYKEQVIAALFAFSTQTFVHSCKGCRHATRKLLKAGDMNLCPYKWSNCGTRQWNYISKIDRIGTKCKPDKSGALYMSCGDYTFTPFKEEEWFDPEETYEEGKNAYIIKDWGGTMYTTVDEKDSEVIETLKAMVSFIMLSANVSGRTHESDVRLFAETFLSKIPGYAWDEFTEHHLWTYDEIKNETTIDGLSFYDPQGYYKKRHGGDD